jgi:hypothetical protein
MSKNIYDSIFPPSVRRVFETQERLSKHLGVTNRLPHLNSLPDMSALYLNDSLLEKISAFNSMDAFTNNYNSVSSAFESLQLYTELNKNPYEIGLSSGLTPTASETIQNLAKKHNISTSELIGISAGTIGYLENFDALSRYSVLSEKFHPWNEALKVQEALGLPDHIEKYLHGISLDRSIFQGFILESEYERAFEVTSALNTDSVFLGEIEISPNLEDEEGSSENQKIILPEEFRDRLETVQFLPIKLFDQILNDPNLMRGMDPREFENLIAELMYKSGFENIIVTPRSNDKGRDILATKTVCDIPIMFAFECKRYSPENKIKPEIMRALLGTISHHQTRANKGVLVTTSSFSREAKSFIASESMLSGKDFNDLVKWINQVKK